MGLFDMYLFKLIDLTIPRVNPNVKYRPWRAVCHVSSASVMSESVWWRTLIMGTGAMYVWEQGMQGDFQ
jgi:hypothetical protein